MSTQKRIVKFVKSWRGYSEGELAGFDAQAAAALIDGKVAIEHKPIEPPAQQQAQSRTPRGASGKKAAGGDTDQTQQRAEPSPKPPTELPSDPPADAQAQAPAAPAADPAAAAESEAPSGTGADDERP